MNNLSFLHEWTSINVSPHPSTCHPRGGAQLSGENHEIRKQRPFHLKAIISAPFSVISAPSIVIPALFPVTPAEAGAQGNRQDLVSGKAVTPAICCMRPWAPAVLGDDNGGGGGDKS